MDASEAWTTHDLTAEAAGSTLLLTPAEES